MHDQLEFQPAKAGTPKLNHATFARMWELGASIHVLANVATLEFLKTNWSKSFTASGGAWEPDKQKKQ